MPAQLIKTGTWLYDGDHKSRVSIFRDTEWTVPCGPPEDEIGVPPLPRDSQGYLYYARYTVTNGGGGMTQAFGSAEEAMAHMASLLPSPIFWAD